VSLFIIAYPKANQSGKLRRGTLQETARSVIGALPAKLSVQPPAKLSVQRPAKAIQVPTLLVAFIGAQAQGHLAHLRRALRNEMK
jgi:hypothetical protein